MYHKFTFFYQTASPFSQWHKKKFNVNGVIFNCCEQFMMYCKAMLFDDKDTAQLIMNEKEPREHKKLGRLVKNFDQTLWDMSKQEIVYKGNYAKFMQNPDIKKQLMVTAGTSIVEASKDDKIWGIGIAIDDEARHDVRNWQGENLLGYALTKVREDILKEEHCIHVINKMWRSITGVSLEDFNQTLNDIGHESINEIKDLEKYHQQINIGAGFFTYKHFMETWVDLLVDKKIVVCLSPGYDSKILRWEISNNTFSFPFKFS